MQCRRMKDLDPGLPVGSGNTECRTRLVHGTALGLSARIVSPNAMYT